VCAVNHTVKTYRFGAFYLTARRAERFAGLTVKSGSIPNVCGPVQCIAISIARLVHAFAGSIDYLSPLSRLEI
jgi:hypothetical protein